MLSPAPRRPSVRIAATAVAAALALAGCASSGSGGSGQPAGGSGTSSSTGASSSTASTPAPSSSIAALVPSSIASKGTLTFAMDATYPPDESLNSSKQVVGFDADLANALAPLLGLKAQLQNVTFDDIIPGLQSGKYDVGLSSFTDTKAREKVVDFVTYFQAGEGFYVKSGSGTTFDGLSSLCGHTVAVENGTVEQTDADSQAKKCSVKVLTFSDQNSVNLAVSSGRADVGFADSQVAGYIVKQSDGQFENSGSPFGVAPYGIALPKGNGMAKAVLAAMKELISDGTYKSLLAKWGLQAGAITTPVIDGATS